MLEQNATVVASDTKEAIFKNKAKKPMSSMSSISSAASEVASKVASGDVSESESAKKTIEAQRTQQTQQTQQEAQQAQQAKSISSAPASRVNFVNIPRVLKSSCSFCLWRKEKRNGKAIKVPYNPKTGQMAKTNDPSTFSDFSTVMKAYALGIGSSHWDGIGFRVSEGIGAIDIDHCIRPDGSLNDVAASILSFLKNAYFEKSPSGTGLRGLFRLDSDFTYDKTRYYINNRRFGLEVYFPGVTNRFVTLTGDVYRTGEVDGLELNPENIKSFKAENASNFRKKMEQYFVYQKRRPWNETANTTPMVNNVTWADGEELQEGLAPEFDVISDESNEPNASSDTTSSASTLRS